ncbi:BINDING PROTEIN putative-RELATED [Salix viminalis]|uniref:BINDING PROTEIN putative-RELATED n=1 Tax=Salix viminalis TaxID=40686 RepID=A0A9Q0ZJJ3_SALVM|nr:BINDING PROTEIN putative-RELATED [Salix viminalis]
MESILHLLFLLQFLPLLSSSESYNPQVEYFMNCGSDSNVDLVDLRNFVGDENSNLSFSVGKSNSVRNENPLPGILPLYHTARIYTKISHYMLNITQTGSYLVRLHFFPFSFKKTHLADALFNVSAPNFSLLSNFSVRNSSTEFPVIKEFFLTIAEGNFDIYFIPADETRFAFVNAIEAFLLPPKFFIDNLTAIPPLRTTDAALRTLFRINVGGPEINDSLWRNWVPDNDYLTFRSSEQASCNGEPQESRQRLVFKEIAPDDVYRTCRKVSIDNNGSSNIPNITWRFNVSKEARHLVRLHVCDFFSPSPGTVKFDLNISTNFSTVIDPNSDNVSDMSAPLFYDYVVFSDDSGYMSFSIAPNKMSIKKVAFLNGLEIMEFVGNSTFEVPAEHETRKHIALKIGLAGGMPDPDHISMSLKGSFGYLDPEYFRTLQLTNKSDVYSFGVVLLEVLCARPPIVNSKQREEINLVEWGMFWQKEGQLEKIIDPLLVGHINQNSLRKFGEITEKCLKPQGADRPNMLDVCWDLEYALQLQQTPAYREAHEDSTTTAASTDLALPPIQNLSYNMFPVDDYSDFNSFCSVFPTKSS